jgi:hypothetical protein
MGCVCVCGKSAAVYVRAAIMRRMQTFMAAKEDKWVVFPLRLRVCFIIVG